MVKSWIIVLVICTFLPACSEVVSFGSEAIDQIFQAKKDALIIFEDSSDSSVVAHSVMNDFSLRTEHEVLCTYVNNEEHKEHFKRFAEHLGLSVKDLPVILFLRKGTKKYIYSGEMISEQAQILAFLAKVYEGKIKPTLKSAEIPEPNGEKVVTLVGKNFEQVVMKSEKEILIELYAPWCGHCKQLAPHYEKAASILSVNPNLMLAKVDGTLNEIEMLEIKGYPTLFYFSKDKSVKPITFSGERNVEGLISWMKEHTEYDWIDASTEDSTQPEVDDEL